jgi:hypothetical protein
VPLASCDRDDRVRTIDKTRVIEPVGRPVPRGASSAERFGLRAPGSAAEPARLVWDTPQGWQALEPTSMRQANFRLPGDGDAECYLTILGGDGGGLEANINRWRNQMSLGAQTAGEIAALPKARLFDAEAQLVDLEGTWSGMGAEGRAGYRLVGLAVIDSGHAKFLKMTGPRDVVAGELDAFLRLARSFREEGGALAPDNPADGSGEQDPVGGDGFTWEVPRGWLPEPRRPMRTVTFKLPGPDTECYVVVLGGDGGGLAANVNRWRGQMGQPDLASDGLAALTRIPMLGGEGTVVSIDGGYEGMSGESLEAATMLGAVCLLPGRSVFVKMIGPTANVEREHEAFLEFCKSMKEAR